MLTVRASIDIDASILSLDVRFRRRRKTRSRELIEVLERSADRAALTYRFLGPLATLGLVRATRRRVLTRVGEDRTRYETEESFGGLLVPLLRCAGIQRGFDDHARALKRRAEATHAR